MAGHTIPALIAVPFLPLPDPQAIPYLIASVFIHWGYYYLLVSAIGLVTCRLSIPSPAGKPLLVALSALFFINETLSLQGWAGLILVSRASSPLLFFITAGKAFHGGCLCTCHGHDDCHLFSR